jgi:hypothetical protein
MTFARRLWIISASFALAFASGLQAAASKRPADLAPAPAAAGAEVRHSLSQFMRFIDQGAAGGRFETADVVFVNDQGAVVRLVSAVHIGEASYFKGLDDSFRQRDVVLYELVKPRGGGLPVPGADATNAIGQLQRFLKDSLRLEFQLDQIDYSAPNFVHADLDTETFQQMQEERGETFATLMLQQLMKAMTQPVRPAAVEDMDQAMEDLVKLFTRPDMERQIKIFVARQLGEMEEHALGLDGPNGSVIITERNKAAIKVLENVLEDGKKDIAIFYGAAHMPDLAQRLQAMGFKHVATEWRLAWDLAIRHDQPSAIEKVLMDLLRGTDR